MLDHAALLAIGGYQRWLSPRKGYGCAYRIAHGGTGCSGFAKRAIAERGLRRALPLIRQRFRECHAAALLAQTDERDRRGPVGRWCDRWCNLPAGDWGVCCRAFDRDGNDSGGCSSCDGSPNGCDCSPGGCGSH
jgi:putative component of membrane protein insertase Oxa1/YidC/SpoIIIJ protein YidD